MFYSKVSKILIFIKRVSELIYLLVASITKKEFKLWLLEILEVLELPNSYCVYMHTLLIDGRKYIGLTSRDPIKRWGKNGKGYKDNEYFYRAIQKYGWEAFKHEILFKNLTKEQACNKEKALIKLFNAQDPKHGFNITEGGEHWACTESTKQKLSKIHTKYIIDDAKLIDLYLNQNLSMEKCAEYFGCSYNPIFRKLSKLGIVKSLELKQQYKHKTCNITKKEFYHIYIEQNYTKQEAANYFKCSTGTITEYARKFGVKKTNDATKQNVSRGHLKYNILKEDVYKMKDSGLSNKEIAVYYGCCERTIRDYLNKWKGD